MAAALHHIRTGSGAPVLLIPGLGGTVDSWDPLISELAGDHEVVAVDKPGFGRSPALPGELEHSPRNMAAAVLDFHDSLGIGAEPVICGQSLGAWVAIECARAGRARGVLALCPAGFWREPLAPRRNSARTAARLFSPFAGLVMRSEGARARILGGQIAHPERVSRREAVELVRGYARASAYDEANALMRGSVVGDLRGIETPITIAWGERDRLVRNRPLDALPEEIRQVVLPDAGHLPTWDQPELIAGLIRELGDRAPLAKAR